MSDSLAPLMTFHLSGERADADLGDIGAHGLSPALFSGYGDLTRLRHDYPLVLVDDAGDGPVVRSLTDIVDGLLREIAPPGIEGERVRRHVLRLESTIRAAVDGDDPQPLSRLWQRAEAGLLARADENARPALADDLDHARAALNVDGATIGCDREMPVRVFTHAWSAVQAGKARRLDDEINSLVLRLSYILKADSMKSKQAVGAEVLKRSVGAAFESAFDFNAMSRILTWSFPDGTLPEKRRQRIRSVLSALRSQRFSGGDQAKDRQGYSFAFECCGDALAAYRQRLPAMVELAKAMTIARLEIDNRYKDASHDAFFRRFDAGFLEADDLARLPSYLVCLRNGIDARQETAPLLEILSSGLPIKVLVQNDGTLADLSQAADEAGFGVIGPRLATMALGLDAAFVLQSGGANLYRVRDAIAKGLAGPGPALFSVFSGASRTASRPGEARNVADPPPYLRTAAATEARAFPIFVYDRAAGADWASRFSLAGNPQAEADWPIHRLAFADDDLQRISEETAFTFVDFVAADERHAESFASVPRSKWHPSMVPAREFLDLDDDAAADKVPYILMVDDGDGVHRVIVAEPLIEAARRCRARWRSLQELAGINNSHAARAVAAAKRVWQEEKEKQLAALQSRPTPAAAAAPVATAKADAAPTAAPKAPPAANAAAVPVSEAVVAEPAAPVAAPSDDPYIETPRCTTCEECVQINNRMFAYDDNKQAYIADPAAGTYRQLVEAAESCQVAIIHPGKPRNENEPGLAELMARAEPFN